jgi:putative ATP-dependent endonuclease of OLD family
VIKVAQHLGIEWHLLADGDAAGQHYAKSARQYARGSQLDGRLTVLPERDVEHCFWDHGYEEVFRRAAYSPASSTAASVQRKIAAKAVIARAIERHSKPYLAVLLLDAAIDRGPKGVPSPLRRAIEYCIQLARHGSER